MEPIAHFYLPHSPLSAKSLLVPHFLTKVRCPRAIGTEQCFQLEKKINRFREKDHSVAMEFKSQLSVSDSNHLL